ncbi:MAG: HAD-IIB family hydrolase [Spirochaetes bacterium]|nr:HAD-IIB family hydrolase [Spirochaetota bacterium]
MNSHPIIFCDIDGTILDLNTYSYDVSLPAIQKLASRDIPLILVSSKTYIEMRKLHTKLSLKWPFIFENGAGIAHPDGTYSLLGKKQHELIGYKSIVHKHFNHLRWADSMSIQELSQYTGLSHADVKDMMSRTASVLFLSDDNVNIYTINDTLKQYGIAITTGGKFFTLIDSSVNKGTAIQIAKESFSATVPSIFSYAVGDGLNDCEMFNAVDEAYFVGTQEVYLSIQNHCSHVHKTKQQGPAGFVEVVEYILTLHSVF